MGTSSCNSGSSGDNLLYFPLPDNVTAQHVKTKGKVKVTVNDKEIVVMFHNNRFYAMLEKCPHRGGPLSIGDIEDIPDGPPCIRCPWHGWKFSLLDGKCMAPRNRYETIAPTLPTRLDKATGILSIGFDHIDPKLFSEPPP